jgi:hypothetical protein
MWRDDWFDAPLNEKKSTELAGIRNEANPPGGTALHQQWRLQ